MRYICQICGYIYDDEKEKIPFDELPDDWKCPLCGASKSDFALEQKEVQKNNIEGMELEDDLEELSIGQLAALCSNLARGCEKQYKDKESALFKELADYFTKITPKIEDSSVKRISELLQEDLSEYSNVKTVVEHEKDRGAQRVCTWGEKVTRMLSSLVNRYIKEGEQMLEGTNIWVCTVCGFVYIGDKAPELCPVCKVPDWKFEKIEGRNK